MNDVITLTDSGQTVSAKGIKIQTGQSRTVELELFSDAPTSGPWKVGAIDYAAMRGHAPHLQFSFDKTTGQNGDKIHMTITVSAVESFGGEPFVVESVLGGRTNLWVGLVGP
jgi:hypothetical protein